MPFTSIDGVIAGMQPSVNIIKNGATTTAGRFYSPFYATGSPVAATAPATSIGLAGTCLSAYTGQLPIYSASTLNMHIANFTATVNTPGTLLICDRLWHNSMTAVTFTGTQTINSPTWPPRDLTGGTNGTGVNIGVEVTTVLGAGIPQYRLAYTSDKGVLNTGTTPAVSASMAVGSFIPIQMESGDTGVQQVRLFLQSASHTSGAFSLVAYRVLTRLDIPYPGARVNIDAVTGGLPRLYNGTVPFLLWYPSTTTAPLISAELIYTQG